MLRARKYPAHEPGSPGEAWTDLVLEVFHTNGRLLAAGDRLAAPAGLTSARWQVLGAVEAEPRTVAQIARAMGMARQSVQRTADLLAAEGILAFAPNPNHRRAKLIAPTPRGRAMLDRVNRLQAHWARRVTEGMSAEEIDVATRILATLRERVERDAEPDEDAAADGAAAPTEAGAPPWPMSC